MGVGPSASRRALACAAHRRPLRVHRLELDLDVFAGPFDLLLTLILREEVDLLEVDLADVVIAYLDHLEARGELDLEAATEFLVLIAALLELKSRLMLPGEEVEELDELEPGEAAEELLARMLALRALPRRGRASARARRARRGASATARRRCRPSCAGVAVEQRRGGLRPGALGAAIGGAAAHAAADRPPPHGVPARHGRPSGSRTCARCCAAARFTFDEAVARRRPHDGRA